LPPEAADPATQAAWQALQHAGLALLAALDAAAPGPAARAAAAQPPMAQQLAVEQAYEALKTVLLAAAARGPMPLAALDAALGRASAARQALRQALQAWQVCGAAAG
jgi:hypothetical protein